MTPGELLSHLRSLDVRVWADKGRLVCDGPRGVMTPALRDALKEHKGAILALLDEATSTASSRELPFQRESRDKDLPLSFPQERLWFLEQLEPGSTAYNIPATFRLKGLLNVAVLERSFEEIVHRHEVLRTTVSTVEGQPIQVISPSPALPLAMVDLSHLSPTEREDNARRLATEEARRPFDLGRGPLLRVTLVRLGEEDHMLLVTMHHIVSDGWSMGVLFRELSALYEAYVADKPSPLPELPIQYADYAVWQRNRLQGEVLETQLSYWKKQLDGISSLQLSTDRPRPTIQSFRGARQSLMLPGDLTQGLKGLSRREGVTLFMTLAAAFQTLLHRLTGQDDIAVGTPIAGRNRSEFEALIGFFVNTLVLRTDLSANPTFRELLARLREVALGAYAHQDLPFEKLVEVLQPERNLGYSPLFQVMFVLQNTPMASLELAGLAVSPERVDSETAKFDLSLSIREEGDGLRASVQYNTDLFNGDTIARMLGHLQNLLQGILRNPEAQIDTLPLMTADEQQQIMDVWSRTPEAYVQDAGRHQIMDDGAPRASDPIAVTFGKQPPTLVHAIAAWAARTPNAVALESSGRMPLTYGGLHAHMDTLARQLRGFGIKRNDRVALVLPDGPEMAVAFLAVARSATAAPLNPGYRADESAFYLDDIKAKALIVQAGVDSPVRAVARARGIAILELSPKLDAEAGLFSLNADAPLKSACEEYARPSDVALVLHTSGTTSRPKLVPLTHANLWASALNVQATVALGQADRCLNIMPLFHIHSLVGALLSSMAAGAAVVCTPGFYAPEFFAWLEEFRPTWYTAVPTMHQAILARAQGKRDIIGRCPLRFIRSCSAALPPRIMKELEEVFGAPVVESYGMTEAAHQIASNPLPPSRRKEGSVGLAAGPEVRIMDRSGNILAAGERGEVVVRGANVTSGYENDISANASALTRGWFRTGDEGYLDSHGYLFLTGRFKEVINRGGEKVSPREVDEILQQHPAVAQAVTFAVSDVRLGEEVAAAVVLREPATMTARQLREFATTRLADFKVPRQIVILDAIPAGPTGKVQRVGLAEKLGLIPVGEATTSAANGFEEPRTSSETLLAEIWAELLGLQRVGRQDNFFDLGGDSLIAARVIVRARTILHAEISTIDFFDNPTLAGLAETIDGAKQTQPTPLSLSLSPVSRATAFPLSSAQRALWFLDQLEPEHWVYNRPLALRLTGAIDVPAMKQSLNEIVRRHEPLRTSFPMVGDAPMQVIASAQPISLRVVDLSAMPQSQREIQAQQLAREEARRPFDLTSGPMLRAALLQLSEAEHVLVVTMHHIASDGWSSTVFCRELAAFYNATKGGLRPGLPPLRIQYVDFAEWQRRSLQGEHLEKLLSYWKQQMGKSLSPRLKFAASESRPTARTRHQGAHRVLKLPATLKQALKTFTTQQNVSLFMTLLAALKTLLYRYTGETDLLVGAPIAGRNFEELDGAIGNFTNMLALRTDLSGNPSFRKLLNRVREVTLQAYAHQDLPLGMLADALRTERKLDIRFPFQVMLNLRNFPSETFVFTDLQIAEFKFDNDIARFELSIDVVEESDGLACFFEYDTARFDGATITQFIDHFRVLLERIVAHPDERIDALPLLSSTERPHPAAGWNAAGADAQPQRAIHHLFEEQVARTPNATAVAYEGSSLSYAGLNRRANQLAHYLRALGIGPDAFVGICMERSLEMAVGLLAILKAGGAYVPLDPRNPKERLAFVLEDMNVSAVLTQQRLASVLPPNQARIVLLDGDWPTIARENDANPLNNSEADQLAYVIYTSGSTGKPKGVLISHRGVMNHSHAVSRHFALHARDRVAQCTSLSFDISVEEIFPSWISGATVVLCPPDAFSPGADLTRWLAQEEITVLNLPTAFWHEWVNELERSQEPLPLPLRLVVVGGEKASPQTLTKWQRIAGTNVRWVNTYGPTEATVTTTCYEPTPDVEVRDGMAEILIGRPVPNSQVYVLDRYLQPAPLGVSGELYIGGYGLARGYFNQPELTAEKFIPHPFSTDPGARLYKTGDLVRFRPDGNLEFIGRTDHQVKLRGFRIEPGEIEAVLRLHPAVRETWVTTWEADPGDRQLAVYVVPEQDSSPATFELQSFLRQKLPDYMVPPAFVFLDSLPLTPNGKIDRRALPPPDQSRPGLEEIYAAPRTPVEEVIAGIWAEVLKLERIGIHDNFFHVGGHSLKATQVMSRISQAFHVEIPLRSLFEYPTVAGLADTITQGQTPDPEALASVLDELEGLSDHDAQRLLTDEQK